MKKPVLTSQGDSVVQCGENANEQRRRLNAHLCSRFAIFPRPTFEQIEERLFGVCAVVRALDLKSGSHWFESRKLSVQLLAALITNCFIFIASDHFIKKTHCECSMKIFIFVFYFNLTLIQLESA